jgi:hypothetical protein
MAAVDLDTVLEQKQRALLPGDIDACLGKRAQ